MNKLLVILGSTSTGKTDIALSLAKKLNGELVVCDSRQIYIGLDIGTGKLPDQNVSVIKGKGFWLMDNIKVWMLDMADPEKQYTAYDYIEDVTTVIADISNRGKLSIIVGGTGLYLKALLEGMPNLGVPVNEKLRKELNNLPLEQLQQKLQKLNPDKWKSMNNSDKQNPRRLIRAIELSAVNANNINDTAVSLMSTCDVLKIGLFASREMLYQRIDVRVVSRINQGMIDEAKSLHEKGLSFERMRKLGLEYGVLADYLNGKIKNKEKLIKILQGKIHGYARRQITWFKKPACQQAGKNDIFWFDITNENFQDKLEKQVAKWYHLSDATKG